MALDKHYKKGVNYDQDQAAQDFIAAWLRILDLQAWDVEVRVVENKPDAWASTLYHLRTLEAKIEFRGNQTCASMEDNAAHEMLHLLHARIDNLFDTVVNENLPQSQRDAMKSLYVDEMEAFIGKMGKVLGKLRRGEIKE